LFYLSQHRKLGDDVVAITQHIGNVDKQFRSVTQDYTYLRNLNKEKFGVFRMMPLFLRSTFLQPATGAPGEKAMETGSFRLDVTGLGSCYDTAAGVGIHNRGDADTQTKARGFPLTWLVVVGALLLLGASQIPRLLAYTVTGKSKPLASLPESARERAPTLVRGQELQNAPSQAPAPEPAQLRSVTNAPRYINSSIKIRGRWQIMLSDGNKYVQGEDAGFEALDKRGAWIDGVRVEWAKPTTEAAGKNSELRPSHYGTVIQGPPKGPTKATIAPR